MEAAFLDVLPLTRAACSDAEWQPYNVVVRNDVPHNDASHGYAARTFFNPTPFSSSRQSSQLSATEEGTIKLKISEAALNPTPL